MIFYHPFKSYIYIYFSVKHAFITEKRGFIVLFKNVLRFKYTSYTHRQIDNSTQLSNVEKNNIIIYKKINNSDCLLYYPELKRFTDFRLVIERMNNKKQ